MNTGGRGSSVNYTSLGIIWYLVETFLPVSPSFSLSITPFA